MYGKLIAVLACALASVVLSATVVWLSRVEGFSNVDLVHFIRDNRTYISIVVQVVSTVLAICQTYVVTSIVVLVTNARLLSPNALNLDSLRLRQAMATKSPIFEWGTKRISLVSILWFLMMQLPAALWAGSVTPIISEVTKNASIEVPNFDTETSNFWASQCAPAEPCDQLLGKTLDLGTFSYVNWKTRTGLLLNAVSQASSRNLSTPSFQKLDGTGFFYHGRSYGVGSAVGLSQPTYSDDLQATIRRYSFIEDGYHANVSCQYNRSSQLSFAKSDLVTTPSGIYAPQGYWVHGSLPNGRWDGFPTWAVVNQGFTASIAAVNNQSRYMYGFLTGEAYAALNQTQCEVWFTPSRFNIDVDIDAKNISVTLSEEKPVDIDSNRALANISFHGVGYLSQTLTTLYTSVLGDSFIRNIDNVRTRNQRKETTDEDVIEAVEEGFELLLDHFLESSGAAQVMLLEKSKPMDGTIAIVVFRVGNFWAALVLLIIASFIGLATVGMYVKYGLWRKILRDPDTDFLDFKSVILGVSRGFGSDVQAVKEWNGQSEDRTAGKLEVQANGEDSSLIVGR